ncbi:hypothetical protein FRIGORI9N_470173 [Frigoribacterium sp. 9N]|nr:hypothetical protein FRIGORI9N_470173 [Frigoribacterium sp. 9N]
MQAGCREFDSPRLHWIALPLSADSVSGQGQFSCAGLGALRARVGFADVRAMLGLRQCLCWCWCWCWCWG